MGKTQRRRAMLYNAFIENIDKKELWRRDNKECQICHEPIKLDDVTLDHVIPLSRGGLHEYANIVCSHEACNLLKGNLLPEEFVYQKPSPRQRKRKPAYVNRPEIDKRGGMV